MKTINPHSFYALRSGVQPLVAEYTISGILNSHNTRKGINRMEQRSEKPLVWIGSSKKDLLNLPKDVQRFFGFALDFAQRGEKHDAVKVMKGFGGAGVLEVLEDDIGGTYRAVYTVKFDEAVFVLHAFQKKSSTA
ncbi:hypothetical protein B738_11163 [Photorhabdus temperata subsp. temperata M1021]|nr:hypothetical protein B738_11163 [Photorhabdus temperata subsp. temperata M1021]